MTPVATPEALAERDAARQRLREAYEHLWKLEADGDLPVCARDKSPPDSLRAIAERAVQMLEEIRAEDAAKGRPWWSHTLAKFALDDLVYALAVLPDSEAALATATAEAASLRAVLELLSRAIDMAKAEVAFAQQDEVDGSSAASRRVRFRSILDALNGVGSPEIRTALARAATAGEGRSDG